MKYLKFLLYALIIVSAALLVVFYATGYTDGMVSAVLNWSLILLVVAVVCTLVLPFFFKSGKGGKGSLIKVGVAVVLCVVSYLIANSDPLQVKVNVEATSAALKWTDAGLKLTVILFVLAVLSICYGIVGKLFKNR